MEILKLTRPLQPWSDISTDSVTSVTSSLQDHSESSFPIFHHPGPPQVKTSDAQGPPRMPEKKKKKKKTLHRQMLTHLSRGSRNVERGGGDHSEGLTGKSVTGPPSPQNTSETLWRTCPRKDSGMPSIEAFVIQCQGWTVCLKKKYMWRVCRTHPYC